MVMASVNEQVGFPQQKMACFIKHHPCMDSEKIKHITYVNFQIMMSGPKMER
jgi:hypothetical protein